MNISDNIIIQSREDAVGIRLGENISGVSIEGNYIANLHGLTLWARIKLAWRLAKIIIRHADNGT